MNREVACDKAKQCKNIGISRFFFVEAEKELFSGKDSTNACGNKLFSGSTRTLWVVPSFTNVFRTHTYILLTTGLVRIWLPTRHWEINCSLKETQQYTVYSVF